ncbi:pseudaminic acid synthase [Desmospora profundinema]|uniref:N-acetylneuraminate synthase n=1 Tax=Desmospora profundinema TaxID=1571184 RepID=A0ABU1IIU8_9BACL|nr:pseudaminic acid synthase [Desmospora profundinema]MDR6224328.1 N-acetylneuraminate synthase [Desmospora profundinema]
MVDPYKGIQIGCREISRKHRPFIIAEMSGNHNRSLERAMKIVDAAAAAGVDAIKLQTYTADSMTLDLDSGDFFIDDPNNLWKGNSLHQLYQKASTPWEWHEPIRKRCEERGLILFSSPFDEDSVDFLQKLGIPCFKIASFENTDIPLIKKVAATGKPVILSTGMASAAELDESIRAAREAGCRDLILLKCTSTYPADPAHSNLLTIPHMRDLFRCQVGLSDHTPGIGTAVAGVALGVTVIEKHLTLSRADGGVDAAFSLEPDEMTALVQETDRAWQAMGQIHYGPTGAEKKSIHFRRSLYVSQDLRAGDVFTKENVRIVRPGHGLPPKYYDIFLGKKVIRDVKKGTPIGWELI